MRSSDRQGDGGDPSSCLNRARRLAALLGRLPGDLAANGRPAILILGLARSGTSWVATTLAETPGVKYYHEPFNRGNVPGAAEHAYLYRTRDHVDRALRDGFRATIRGLREGAYVRGRLAWPYGRWPRWPGRVAVKDVHINLALDFLAAHFSLRVLVVARHPCAVAASWRRMRFSPDWIRERLLGQEELMDGPLRGFRGELETAANRWSRTGAIWGAVHRVLVQQQACIPGVRLVTHEWLCEAPVERFRELFGWLGVPFARETADRILWASTRDSGRAYEPQRIARAEVEKWRREIGEDEARQVLAAARPFGSVEALGY